jgi:hypothetical protein
LNEKIIFLREINQLSSLLRFKGELINQSRLISLDLDVSATLEELGLSYEEMWEYINIEEFYNLREEAYHLSYTWFKNAEESLSKQLYYILSIDKEGWINAFRDALVANLLFHRIITENTKKIYVWGPLDQYAYWELQPNDIPDAVWAFLAEKAGLDLNVISIYGDNIHNLWHRYRNVLRQIKLQMKILFENFNSNNKKNLKRYSILFFLDPTENQRYYSICEELKKIYGNHFTSLIIKRFITVEGVFSQSSHIWGELISPLIEVILPKTLYLWIRKSNQSNLSQSKLPIGERYPYIFKNNYMNFQFNFYSQKHWPYIATFMSRIEHYFKELKPKAIIVTEHPYTYQSPIYVVAKKLKIPVITVPHSATLSIERFRLLADAAIVWTEDYKTQLIEEGMYSKRIHVIGIPSDMIFKGYPTSIGCESSIRVEKRKMILVLSAKTHHGLLPPLDISAYKAIVNELINIPNDLINKIHLYWKCHPACDHRDYYKMIIQKYGNSKIVSLMQSEPIEPLLEEADIVVIPNTPNSAYLAALLFGKPLIFINAGYLKKELFKLAQGEGFVIEKICDIWHTIRQILFDSNFRSYILSKNRSLLNELTIKHYPLSSEQVAYNINQVVNKIIKETNEYEV